MVSDNSPGQLEAFKRHFLAGAIGLSLSYSCMHPLDTIKTRIQADPTNGWRSIFTRQTAHSLSKGFLVSALGAAGQGGARFSTYEFCKMHLLPSKDKSNNKIPWLGTVPATALSAVIGDLASSLIKVPREVITAKLQTDHYSSLTKDGRVTTSFVVKQTLKEEGPRGLLKGFWPIAARDSPFMIILLVSYENFKAFHHRSVRDHWISNSGRHSFDSVTASTPFEEFEADIPTFRSIMYGGISGFLAGYFTTPMDVLRTRLITQKSIPNKVPLTATQVAREMIHKIALQHSHPVERTVHMSRAFFAGAIPRSLWWFGICGIFFPVYETLKSGLSPK
ncbi:mitochondrial carrier domain-containing protein [Spinellus fusiger]|nr:mitochondrial carrier domain-containing protein [Spinellus fusiger]